MCVCVDRRRQAQDGWPHALAQPRPGRTHPPSLTHIPQRRASVLGDIVESKDSLPEPDAADFFEGDQWQWLGSVTSIAVPILIAGAVAVGIFAAKTYDTGADAVLLPASGEDRPALIAPAPVVGE